MLQMLRLLNESKLVKELRLIRYVNEGDLLYIWVDSKGNLIARWDNAPHHKDVRTYPHHMHLPDGSIKESTESDGIEIVEHVLSNIRIKISHP